MSVDPSTSGTLDFKQASKVTFIGSSSNTVIDTVTGSFGIGVDVNGPSSNLHVVGNTRLEGDINMLHTSNNAAIKLNSNVVTEFPRSKKLIKYPRVALTGSTSGGYTASASATNPNRDPYYAFDNVLYSTWHEPVYQVNPYPNLDGAYTGGSGTVYDTNGYQGEYLQIQLPEKIKLYNYSISNRAGSGLEGRQPKDAKIFASNDGTTWIDIHTHSDSGGTYDTTGETRSFQLDNITETHYKYYRLVMNSIIQGGTSDTANISQWELYGLPEYDPDADGVDVKVTSYPNVPNTDWLEVYYDAKDLADGAVTSVDDLTPSGTNDGTATNVNVSDGAFVFNGTNSNVTTGTTLSDGAYPHSVSLWYYTNDDPSALADYLFQLGDNTENNSPSININGATFYLSFYGNYLYNPVASTGIQAKKWVQISYSYDGGPTTANNPAVYIDGKQITMYGPLGNAAGSALSLVLGTDPNVHLTIGSRRNGTLPVNGKIANFRLFNRPLTADEIYQLYAYQKEYFGYGDLSMTLKAGRLGIGTSEPRAALDVRGGIAGPFTTFLTGDVTTSIITSAPSTSTIYPVTSYTFDVPSEYHAYGTKNLEIYGQIKWCGEIDNPWNAMFSARVYYGSGLTSYVDSAENTSSTARTRNNGAGVPSTNTTNDDYISTLEACILSTRFYIPNCPVSNGSQLKLELRFRQGNATSSLYTNRTVNDLTNDVNYERGTTNFFLAVK